VWVSNADGDPITFPIYQPATAPRLLVYLAPDGTPEVVDATGQPVSSPPTIAIHPGTGEPAIVDANGQFVVDSKGNPTTLPAYSPPTQGIYAHVLTDPVTGAVDVQIVDAAGNLVPSPPGYKLVQSADPSVPPTVVLTGANGQPLTDANGNQLSPPTFSPPTQGIYAHMVTDPVTGEVDVQIVDAAGNLVPSPPGYTVQKSADPSDPPTIVLTGADGKPLTDQDGNPISVPLDQSSATPPGTSPPVEEDTTDEGTTDTSADVPGEAETAAEEEGARGGREPVEETEPAPHEEVLSVREGKAAETPAEEASHVDQWSSETGEAVAAADLGGRVAEAIVADEEPVSRDMGDAGEESVVESPDMAAAGGPVEVSEIEGTVTSVPEPDAVQFKVETTPSDLEAADVRIEAVGDEAGLEERSAGLESEIGQIDPTDGVPITPVTAPDVAEELIPVESTEAVGPVGLGAEELVEMVSGPVAEEGEVAAREAEGPSAGGEQVVEIPDLLSPELDRKGDDRPVPGQGDVEFRVDVAPAEEVVDAEPIAEVVEVDSVTGLGSDELGGVLAGGDATIAAAEAGEGIVERVEAEGSGLGEEVPELKWGTETAAKPEVSLVGEALEPDLEGKPIPVLELEEVEFKVEMAPAEEALAEFRVEVAEAGTLEIDEEAAGGLARVVEEPEDEPVGRYLMEEEPEEEEEIQP
jgi:hypothetical protein